MSNDKFVRYIEVLRSKLSQIEGMCAGMKYTASDLGRYLPKDDEPAALPQGALSDADRQRLLSLLRVVQHGIRFREFESNEQFYALIDAFEILKRPDRVKTQPTDETPGEPGDSLHEFLKTHKASNSNLDITLVNMKTGEQTRI